MIKIPGWIPLTPWCLLTLCAVSSASAEPPEQVLLLGLAARLHAEGNAYEAVTEYKRVLFHFRGEVDVAEVCGVLAMAAFDSGELDAAVAFAISSVEQEPDDDTRELRRLDVAALLIADGRASSAIMELVPLTLSEDPDVVREARLLLFGANVHERNWERATSELHALLEAAAFPEGSQPCAAAAEIDSLLAVRARGPAKSASTATLLSTILPGAGQLYAGHPLEALHAFVLNSACAWWTYSVAVDATLFEAAAGPSPWLIRYYTGNRFLAGERVREDMELADDRLAEFVLSRMPLLSGMEGEGDDARRNER